MYLEDSELLSLYKDILFPLSAQPSGRDDLKKPPSGTSTKHSRMCGDTATVEVVIEELNIQEIRVTGESCSICKASGSLLHRYVTGMTISNALEAAKKVDETLDLDKEIHHFEGDMMAINSIRRFPHRKKCAMLPWEALTEILSKHKDSHDI